MDGGSRAAVADAARLARDRCYGLMHEDAEAYGDCIDGLLASNPSGNRRARLQRLGIAYFGWVGANNSARMSLPGSREAAVHFLRLFRPLQKKLGIDDDTLCGTLPGDCRARNSRMLVTEQEASHPASKK